MPESYAQAVVADAMNPEIRGTIVRLDSRPAPWDKETEIPIVVLRLDSGDERSLHCTKAVLRREITEASPMIGERLEVAYAGEAETEGGRPYTNFEVKFPEREAA